MIVVAHRLQTIIESDRVLVLDTGKVAEFDTPTVLRKRPESHFAKLINEIQMEEEKTKKDKEKSKKEEDKKDDKKDDKKEEKKEEPPKKETFDDPIIADSDYYYGEDPYHVRRIRPSAKRQDKGVRPPQRQRQQPKQRQ